MKIVYVVMRTVDLGGHPVKVFGQKEAAEAGVDKLNEDYRAKQIDALMQIDYTRRAAEKWVKDHPARFYLEEVEADL